MRRVVVTVHSWWIRTEERAAGLVEYALLIALIALALVAAVTFLGNMTNGSLNTSGSSILQA